MRTRLTSPPEVTRRSPAAISDAGTSSSSRDPFRRITGVAGCRQPISRRSSLTDDSPGTRLEAVVKASSMFGR